MLTSIRAKFTLWYVGSFAILLLLSFGITEVLFRIFAVKSIDEHLFQGATRFENALKNCLPLEQHQHLEAFNDCFDKYLRELFPAEIVLAQLLKVPEDGQNRPGILAKSYTLQGKTFPWSQKAIPTVANNTSLFETLQRDDWDAEIRLLTLPIHLQGLRTYILQIGLYTGEKRQYSLTSRPHIFFIVFPVLLVIGVSWGYIFMKRAFAPIHTLVMLAKRITAEDLSHRIEGVNSKDEIGELADTFNEMIARLERSFQQIQQFSGDVSHELKTPLTAIKGELEVALRKERSPEEYQEILHSLLEETDKLGKIVEDLLFLSRMDAHSIPLTFIELPLDELLMEVYEETYRLAEQKQLALDLKEIEPLKVTGDLGLLKRVLCNLLINAINYTPEGGKIELALTKQDSYAVCTVADTGIGIPEAELPYIFDRFYRVDHSRSHDTGGAGLGLAIVQKIIEAHGGKIEVSSEEGKGTTFRVCLSGIFNA